MGNRMIYRRLRERRRLANIRRREAWQVRHHDRFMRGHDQRWTNEGLGSLAWERHEEAMAVGPSAMLRGSQ